MNCVACLSPALAPDPRVVPSPFALLRCGACGMGLLQVPVGADEHFDEYWDEINERIYSTPAVVDELDRKYARYLDLALKRAPNQRLLDVGSGAGIFVERARTSGFEAAGVEPSARAVELGHRQRGVDAHCGLLTRDDDLPRGNGVLTLWDVIEHVHDPEELVSACRDHLADDGVFILETPDEGALARRLVRWVPKPVGRRLGLQGNIYYPDHRYYFTRKAMAALLTRCGFDRVTFFSDHTMFKKSLEKMRLYNRIPPLKEALYRAAFVVMGAPFMANKMVVICQRRAGPTP